MRFNVKVEEISSKYFRFTFEGLPGYDECEPHLTHMVPYSRRTEDELECWYPGVCQYFSEGDFQTYTLPYAVFADIYDLVQSSENIKDGDEFVFVDEGEEYITVVNSAWPHCEKAALLERKFREENGIEKPL